MRFPGWGSNCRPRNGLRVRSKGGEVVMFERDLTSFLKSKARPGPPPVRSRDRRPPGSERATLKGELHVREPMEPDKRVAAVTGASSGFGKATASLLAARGFRVFGTSRTPRADRWDGFEMVELDVDSDGSVYRGVKPVPGRA